MHAADAYVVVHLSDLHFGREDRHVVRALRDAVWNLEPDVVAISGDLTQRARRRQFRRARSFLESLPTPRLVVPGNHDVPLFNLAARLLNPLGGYTRYISQDLLPTVTDGALWVAGINTTRPLKWKSGRVDSATLEALSRSLARAPADSIKVLVAHHPFDAPDGSPACSEALTALVAAGVDVFLTGHLHVSYTGHTAHRYNAAGRTAVVVEAGTATSTRLRDESNAFNVLRIGPRAIDVEMRAWDGTSFGVQSAQRFSRVEHGWTGAIGNPDDRLPSGTKVAE